MELPATSILQRFGSLTWRKKRFSALEYNDATPNVSTTVESQWSVGRLERPAVGSEMDLESRRPKSCIAVYPFPQLTPKNSEHSSKREPNALEVSTSFDCIADDDRDSSSSSQKSVKGKNVKLPFAFPERLEGEEEESLPCWAESIFKDYITQDQNTSDSQLSPLSRDSNTTEVIEKHKEPDQYRSPLYHRMLPDDLMGEDTFLKENQVKTSVFSTEDDPEALNQNKLIEKLHNQAIIKEARSFTKHIPLYTSILSQDVAQLRTGPSYENLSPESQNNASSFPELLRLSTDISPEKKPCNSQTSTAQTNNIQVGLQRKTTELQKPPALEGPFQDQIQNTHSQIIEQEPAHSMSDSSTASLATIKDDCKPQASPNTARVRYEVIIMMTKEEKDPLPRLAEELVKAEELVGQDLRMSPSLESQACACHGAGLTEMTAQDISETPEQTEKNTAQEEEIAEEKGGETPKGAHLYR